MRIEEQAPGSYNKYPDQIDSSLIRIINRYFGQIVDKDDTVIDSIIDEVLERVKLELGISGSIGTPTAEPAPTILISKTIMLGAGEIKEYVLDDPQDISNITIEIGSKVFYSRYGTCICSVSGDTSVSINAYHDIINSRKIIRLKNDANTCTFKITVFG